MAYSLEQRFWCQRVLRFGFAFVCVCLGGYIVGPTSLLWRLKDKSRPQVSCLPCVCDCSSHTDDFFLTPGLADNTYSGCGQNDPDLNQELEKDTVALLSEEIALQKIVSKETMDRTSALTMDAKRASSHYQKEAEKCNAGVETCEEAREWAEAQLREELKLTALWEQRARQLGWKDRKRVYT
ncbi:hypothetical protein CXB51_003827 [Gossypium anomalum]|uniref:DUF1068 domain-containing protein n=1 Tax=Gossypium anomalum TaxID=47600 RepID=A0A8J5ZHN2_9ROSI|nr:hypothetical protein CXB51_003827 [Gossypium anomalum]